MGSILAIVSKKVFDGEARGAKLGSVYATTTYASKHKSLSPLEKGGTLFLVTVRPPEEKLWLVAVLESPKLGGDGWKAAANAVPITDISGLRAKIQFTTGSGMSQKSGALGMSLQTPRELTDADVKLLRAAAGGAPIPAPTPTPAPTPARAPARAPTPAPAPTTTRPPLDEGNIHWTEEAKGFLRPRTREELSPLPTPSAAWRAWQRKHYYRNTVSPEGDRLQKLAVEVTTIFQHHEEPPELDVERWALMFVATGSAKGVDYLCARGEPLLALEALVRSHSHSFKNAPGGYVMHTIDPATSRWTHSTDLPAALLRAEPSVRDACRALAETAWANGPLPVRFSLHDAFPDRDDWANELAADWVKGGGTADAAQGRLLVSTVTDLELSRAVLKRAGASANCVELLRTFGERAVPVLAARLDEAEETHERRHLGRALSLVWSREAGEAIAQHLNVPSVRPFAGELFGNHPELAKAILPGLATGKTKAAKVARELLERVAKTETTIATADVGDEATADELPWILSRPPWRTPVKEWPKRAPLVVEGLTVPDEPGALHAAERVRSLRHMRKIAPFLAWVARNPSAAVGLVPGAVGLLNPTRDVGEIAIRHLARIGRADIAREAAAAYGPAARAAVDEILAWDDRWDAPKKPPKMPAMYRPTELHRPRLRNGKALPLVAVDVLAEMLAFTPRDFPYAGIVDVVAACDPRSIAEWAWDLARTWETDGARKSARWMIDGLAFLADGEVTRRTTPALRSGFVIEALERIGTDAAVMELATITARARRKAYRSYAEHSAAAALRAIAEQRGLSVDEMEERFVPTCDVGDDGTLWLDYGSRRVKVGFDEHLAPYVLDEDGKRSTTLPNAASGDDGAKVRAAKATWTDLKEDVDVIAARRGAALERAMLDRRSWGLEHFRAIWWAHPLLCHLARGVVWEALRDAGRPVCRFRVTEDRRFTTVDDEPVELGADIERARVGHPVEWSAQERDSWRTLFADYRVLQPFAQLDREIIELEPSEASETSIARPISQELSSILDELRRLGFERKGGVWSKQWRDEITELRVLDGNAVLEAKHGERPIPWREADVVARTEVLRLAARLV